jgi:arylsulfatase A-like enzyme
MENYAGLGEYADYEVGRLINSLKEAGIYNNTMIVYITGDDSMSAEGGLTAFESAAILLYLSEKFGEFLPTEAAPRAECLSWLFLADGKRALPRRRVRSLLSQCAPEKIEYAIDRFTMG